jgi:ferric-dicitrate binding protein FerR (iron transport regulator)
MSNQPEARVPEERRELEVWLQRYWDNALTPAELAAWNAALASQPELRAALSDLSLQALALAERFSAERAVAGPVGGPALLGRRRWRLWTAGMAATFLLAATIAWLVVGTQPAKQAAVIAQLEHIDGEVRGRTGDGPETELAAGQSLLSGQTLATLDDDSSAQVRFTDGTRLLLSGRKRLRLGGAPDQPVRLHDEDAAVEVSPQPGTKLSVAASGPATCVAVVEGQAEVTRSVERQSVALRRGQSLAIGKAGPLRPLPMAAVPDTFTLSFGPELPAGWGTGTIVGGDLPAGSLAAVRAAAYPTKSGASWYRIRTHNAWTRGLFAIHDDSVLHLRFRMEKPFYFQVLVAARGADPTQFHTVNLEAQPPPMRRQPGVWYTVNLPLAKFRRHERGTSPAGPLIAYVINLDSQQTDRGLTIDRLWVTRGPE